MFDEAKFNWKKAIFENSQRLMRVELKLDNHLKSHQSRVKWVGRVMGTIIAGLAIWYLTFKVLEGILSK